MSAIGQPAEGAPEATAGATGTAEAAPGPDISAVMDRVGEIASGLGELQSGFQEFVQGQQPAPEPEPDGWESLFGSADQQQQLDQFGNPVQPQAPAPALDPQALQQAVQQAIQSQLGPVAQQVQAMQQQQQLAQLYEQVPQLAPTPENAEIRAQTAQRVQDALNGAPPEIASWLSNSPSFIQTVFKAAEADRLAQAQEPAGGPQVLEGGGATPGGTGGQGQSIVEQAMASRFQTPAGWR
jgi:hypothetical protein